MRYSLAAFLLLSLSLTASAQYTQPSAGLDAYQGLNGLACTNTNTAFSIVTINHHKVFCTPAGHGFFSRGVVTFDLFNPGSNDESGTTYDTYAETKWGSRQAWANGNIALMKTWGLNFLGPYQNINYTLPWQSTSKIPFMAYGNIAGYSTYDPQNYRSSETSGNCLPKNLESLLVTNANWTALNPSSGLVDFIDPCWGYYIASYLAHDGAFSVGTQSTANKHYLIGVGWCDSDSCHGFGAGPDYPAVNGNTDIRLGYVSLFIPPTYYLSSNFFSIGTVYEKKQLHDNAIAAHTNIANINTAWGSSYTTDLTSGTCFGSLQPSWLCPSPSAAASTSGSGSGPYTVTLNTTVSHFSVYIAVGSTIVGGDLGNGNLYGTGSPTITAGSINYATGAFTVTFSGTPGSAPVVGYIQNGFAIGTGLMDEDCRAGHQTYCGNGGSSAYTLTGVAAGLQTDVNSVTKSVASSASSQADSAIQTWASNNGFIGRVLDFGIFTFGSWGVPPDRYVLQGFNGNVDFIVPADSGGSFSKWSQSMVDFVNTYMPGVALVSSSYRTANAQSAFSWPNSAATHSGTLVTLTVATPQNFYTGGLIDVTCNNADYNVVQIHPASSSGSTVTYNTGVAPSEASATCNLFWDDNNVMGYATQALRASALSTDEGAALSTKYTSTGMYPYVGWAMWAWQDYWNEFLNWGMVTQRDNPYDGVSDVNPVVACQAPNAGVNCGGELALHGPPLGDFIDIMASTNTTIDNTVLGFAGLSSGSNGIGGTSKIGGQASIH
jgi:hypothetical protein